MIELTNAMQGIVSGIMSRNWISIAQGIVDSILATVHLWGLV
ncbi:hypothetical protein [Convivina praedatoris]|uniref:Uncharacterized protein n=1 Tax=Convivina praedatoris TaxID=2880963 RepID=A0ABN8H9J8_9LACO|nr:hypothetical protein [Convivina sp. LMG 32447]CAH1852376.1 hypothetical protein R077815_00556 [Convivina sp. LMG 32447]CAH1853556.1 hypothetical protein R078138_00674 [Convivina sp. LMG 32447]CAH1854507.1 hypothetical protein LMG032447_00888 [Convivina sp. LMG 32447]